LQPFATQTDTLQTDSTSLSNILPSILDLECHLQQHPTDKQLTISMLHDLHTRFQSILQPQSDPFNPLPAAACLLDPTLAPILLAPELAPLLNAAKQYIISLGSQQMPLVDTPSPVAQSTGLQRFAFLAAKMNAAGNFAISQDHDTVLGQLNRYLAGLAASDPSMMKMKSLEYWAASQYSQLRPIAEDLISSPASQAYVERIFSLCGLLTAGRRNRMRQSLEMRVFLKLNKNI